MQRLRKIIGVSVVVALAIVVLHLAHTHALEPLRAQVEGYGCMGTAWDRGAEGHQHSASSLTKHCVFLLAGALLGFRTGLITIYITDLVFCQIAFLIAKRYGQKPVQKLVGEKASKRIESFNQSQIEGNPFLLTGLLMTGLFDFVSYAAGLGGTKWKDIYSSTDHQRCPE